MLRILQRLSLFVGLLLILNSIATAAARPNIVVLLADDQRPDTIHALGNLHFAPPISIDSRAA